MYIQWGGGEVLSTLNFVSSRFSMNMSYQIFPLSVGPYILSILLRLVPRFQQFYKLCYLYASLEKITAALVS
jgi:hypothetical protein